MGISVSGHFYLFVLVISCSVTKADKHVEFGRERLLFEEKLHMEMFLELNRSQKLGWFQLLS